MQLVDGFYALLGTRHWIFHDSLDTDMVRRAITRPADEAQETLIAHYKEPDSLRFMLSRSASTARFAAQRAHRPRRRDYEAGAITRP